MFPANRRTALRWCSHSLLLALFVYAPIWATQNINTQALTKCLVFFYPPNPQGQPDEEHPLGTGFLMSVPTLADPTSRYLVLITARHIVDPSWAGCPGPQPQVIWARLNKKVYDPKKDESGIIWMPLHLNMAGNEIWHFAREDEADVAVTQLNAKAVNENADFNGFPISELATSEEAGQRVPTDPIISAGLLLPYPGVKRNYPVIRFGFISTKPDELIASQCMPGSARKLKRVWLLQST